MNVEITGVTRKFGRAQAVAGVDLLLKDMPPGQVPRAAATAIEHVGLGERARARLRTLSGGMLRRARSVTAARS